MLKLIFWRCRATVRGIPLAFAYLQKATLGSTPCRRFWPSVGPLPTEFFQRRQEAPGAFLVPSEREVRQCPQKETLGSTKRSFGHLPFSPRPSRPSSMSFGHLPGAFLEIFFWFQKATLGTRLPLNVLNVSRRPRLPLNLFPGALRGPAACPLATCRALSWRFSSGFRKQR